MNMGSSFDYTTSAVNRFFSMNSCLTIGKEIEVDFESELQVLKF